MKEQYGIRSPNSGLCGLALIINISYLTIDETDGQKIKTERNGSEKHAELGGPREESARAQQKSVYGSSLL